MSNPIIETDSEERPWKRQKKDEYEEQEKKKKAEEEEREKREEEQEEEEEERRAAAAAAPVAIGAPPTPTTAVTVTATASASVSTLTRDPISLILPFLSLCEFATSAVSISRVWLQTAQMMQSRQDRYTIQYFSRTNKKFSTQQQQHRQRRLLLLQQQLLLYSSSLRHHVAHLHVQLVPLGDTPAVAAATTTAADDASRENHLTQNDQLLKLNTIALSMSHLKSLEVDTGSDCLVSAAVSQQSVGLGRRSTKMKCEKEDIVVLTLPPRLQSLRINYGMPAPDQSAPIDDPEWMAQNERMEKWLLRFFHAITQSDSLCASVRILETHINVPTVYRTSTVIAAKFHKMIALRRLALISTYPYAVDDHAAFMDAIRTIPQLCEFEGPNANAADQIGYLLRSPRIQSFRKLLCCTQSSTIRDDDVVAISVGANGGGISPESSAAVPIRIAPDILIASLSHSLIEFVCILYVSPSFLPRFIHLRYLNLIFVHDFIWLENGPPMAKKVDFDAETVVVAISQLITLKQLLFDWRLHDVVFNQGHIERLLTPLIHLEDLSISSQPHKICSLTFLSRCGCSHLISGLRCFTYVGRLTLLDDYRVIYLLTQLRLLSITQLESTDDDDDPEEWRNQLDDTHEQHALDIMFRPRTQLYSSYFNPNFNSTELEQIALYIGPGQKPDSELPHLKHFMQPNFSMTRSKITEWIEYDRERERQDQEELLRM